MVAPALEPYVASMTAYDVAMPAPGIHRGLPSPTLTFVLPAGGPLDVSWAGAPDTLRSDWSSVSGLHTGPAHIHHGLRQAGIQLAVTPAGARALFGMPIGAVSSQLLALDDLGIDLPAPLSRLPEELHDLTDPAERTRLVEHRLVDALATTGAQAPRAEVGHALARLTGGAAVRTVAEETGYSRRHLTALFHAECGIGPKEFQRIARFDACRRRWRAHLTAGDGSLAGLAIECGYADQSHLTREWVAMAGCTPTTWAREEFPFVQDVGEPDPAG